MRTGGVTPPSRFPLGEDLPFASLLSPLQIAPPQTTTHLTKQ